MARIRRNDFLRLAFAAIVVLPVTWYVFIYEPQCPAATSAPPGYGYPRRYTHSKYILNHPNMCETNDIIKMVILVVSSPDNWEARRVIRRTWGSVVKWLTTARLVFLLGNPKSSAIQEKIVEENSIFGDIVQEAFEDSYSNLTLKSVMMIKWLTTFCNRAHYAIKIDDDCFLHPFNLMTFLDSPELNGAPPAAIFGDLYLQPGYLRPHRCAGDKWSVTKEEFDGEQFPPFCDGSSYVMSRAAIPLLYDAALSRQMIRLEDVFLTGLCADDAGVSKFHELNIGLNRINPPACVLMWYPNLITYHKISLQQSENLWRYVVDPEYDPCQR